MKSLLYPIVALLIVAGFMYSVAGVALAHPVPTGKPDMCKNLRFTQTAKTEGVTWKYKRSTPQKHDCRWVFNKPADPLF